MKLDQYLKVAEKIADVIDFIMFDELRAYPPEMYELGAAGERVALVASFNPLQMGRSMNVYESDATARRISQALDGLPVTITRRGGLHYVISLSARPTLPKMVELPMDTQAGRVYLGVRHNGKQVVKPWALIGHTMAAGKTRSGKSTFLRLMGWQALRDGFMLAIADNDQATFPMLRNHPALFAPLATDPTAAYELIERLAGECDSRAAQFADMPGYPDTLDAYNGMALANGKEAMKPILVILDELNNTIIASGSKQKQLTNLIGALSMRALKFGIHIVFAAHEFTKEQIGLIRPQCETIICFKNDAADMSALMGCAGAERIGQERRGMCVSNKWGRLQTFWIGLERFEVINALSAPATSSVCDEDAVIIRRAMDEASGKMSIPLLKSWGLQERKARTLIERLEGMGWLKADPQYGNARYVTDKLAELMSSRQGCQSASTPQIWGQGVSNGRQSLDMGVS